MNQKVIKRGSAPEQMEAASLKADYKVAYTKAAGLVLLSSKTKSRVRHRWGLLTSLFEDGEKMHGKKLGKQGPFGEQWEGCR